MKLLTTLLGILFFISLYGQDQEQNPWLKKLDDFKLKPIIGIQLWSSYTIGAERYNEATQLYESVDNRLNFQIRRTRLGLKGKVYKNLKFNITTALDLIGRDILAGTEGGANNGSFPKLGLWNAWLQWRIKPKSEAFNLTFGYFSPQIGRESITGAFRSTSMEKSWSQNYLRRHLTGIGPGRAVGMNMGGLFLQNDKKLAFSYDIGIFNPIFQSYSGNSIGNKYAPLLIGRLVLHIGDPEFEQYTFSHKVNYFGKRKGLTVALAGAIQGTTDLFTKNQALGLDLLFNWKALNIDGEWTYLKRNKGANASNFIISSNTGYVRIGYNLSLKNQFILEPVIMIVQFNGPLDAIAQEDAALTKSLSGKEQILDIGFNLHLNPDLKLAVHYTTRTANSGAAGAGATINNYFFQDGAGAIHRGDWFGVGVVAIF